jgi:hypothetical protein
VRWVSSHADDRSASVPRPLPVRISFPEEAEEKGPKNPDYHFTSEVSGPRAQGYSEAGL